MQGKSEGDYDKMKWTGSSRSAPAPVLLALARVAYSSLSILYHCQRRVYLAHLLSSFGVCNALFCAMQEQCIRECGSQQFCPLQRSWRRSEGFSLLSEELLPKYITPMRRHGVACLAPPLAAFGNGVFSTYARLKALTARREVAYTIHAS